MIKQDQKQSTPPRNPSMDGTGIPYVSPTVEVQKLSLVVCGSVGGNQDSISGVEPF